MIFYIIIFFSLLCAVFYVFVVPYKLTKKKIEIQPNIFESFVENDEGYIWSTSSERKKSYKDKIETHDSKNKN